VSLQHFYNSITRTLIGLTVIIIIGSTTGKLFAVGSHCPLLEIGGKSVKFHAGAAP